MATPQYVAAPGGYHPHPPLCRNCGGGPVSYMKVRSHVGALIYMKFERLDGPFCRDCGIAVVRQMTTRTLFLGWWSPFSLAIFTPFTLIWNLIAYRKFTRLPSSIPAPGRAWMDPGKPVLRRPIAYVALIPLLWFLGFVVTGIVLHS